MAYDYWAGQAKHFTTVNPQGAYDRVNNQRSEIDKFAQFCKEIPDAEICCREISHVVVTACVDNQW